MDHQEAEFPRQRPLERHARIEADLYCENCGYNLHTQPVVRDERLGILVVRCTECGRFQPAAVASNAGRIWLLRLGAIAVVLWAVIVTVLVVWGTVGLSALQVGTVEMLTMGRNYDANGQEVYRSWDPNAQKTVWYVSATDEPAKVAGNPAYRRSWRPAEDVFEIPAAAVVVACLMMLAPVFFGGVLAVLMWHVSRTRLLLALALPAIGAAIIILIFHVDEYDRGGNIQLVAKLVIAAAIAEMMLMVIGMNIGRPVARFFAKYFIPPRPRQAIAFLWTVDGKKPSS